MELEIRLEGIERLTEAFRVAPSVIQSEMLSWAHEKSKMLQGAVADATPYDSGLLRNSILGTDPVIEAATPAGPLGVTAVIGVPEIFEGTPLNYAIPVELGTGPHIITAKNKPFLKFKVGGHWVQVKSVNHPGTKGAHMFQKTLDAKRDELQQSFNEAIERALAKVFGSS